MSVDADTLLDRIHLKSQLARWRLLALAALVLTAVVAVEKTGGFGAVAPAYIARISIDGIILDDPETRKLIERVAQDKRARAVIVRIDSPGGSSVGGEQLYLDLRALAQHKPVVAVMRGMATSAGYLAALGTDQVFAREGTITGSIGVIIQMAEITKLFDKLGITPITVKSAPLKGSPSPFEKLDPAGQAVLESVVHGFYEYFVNVVAERRKIDHDAALKLADGRIFTGRQALEVKLVDAIGGEEEATDWLVKNKKTAAGLKIEDVKPEPPIVGIFAGLSGLLPGRLFKELAPGLDGLVSIWHPNAL